MTSPTEKPQNECEVLLKAAEILDEQGWCQGDELNCRTGRVCAIGAVRAVIHGVVGDNRHGWMWGNHTRGFTIQEERLYTGAVRRLDKLVQSEQNNRLASVVNWNDSTCQSKEELQALLRRAAGVK